MLWILDFLGISVKEFLTQSLSLSLPHLILKLRPAAIERIAKELNSGVEKLLLKYVHFILSAILLSSDSNQKSSCFRLLRTLLQFPLSSIFNFRKMDLVMLLIEKLGETEGSSNLGQIQIALRWVVTYTETTSIGEGEDEVFVPHVLISEEEFRSILGLLLGLSSQYSILMYELKAHG